MKKNRYRNFVLVFIITSCVMLGGCESNDVKIEADSIGINEPEIKELTSKETTLSVGLDVIDSTYNPIYYHDKSILAAVFANVCSLDSDGKLVDEAGHVSVEEVIKEDGKSQFLYTVSIQEDMFFSDGEPVTIDDVLAYYYICADPTYDGSSRLKELDIVGLKEYYYDVQDSVNVLAELEKYKQKNISKEDFVTYIVDTKVESWFDGISMSAGGPAGNGSLTWGQYCAMCGVATLEEVADIQDDTEMLMLLAEAEWVTCAEIYDPYTYYKTKMAREALADGISVDEISGITRIDDYTCTILLDSFDIAAENEIASIPIIPEHYYCTGFEKGNLLCVEEKSTVPLGSGEYVFESYEKDSVFLKANENYFKGCPEITNLKIQLVSEKDKIDAVLNEEINITDLKFSTDVFELLDQNAEQISYDIVGEDSYGYIGIHSKEVNDLNVRKGLMHMMDRESAINAYYGDYGTIVERPMIPTLAEYPQNAKPYYQYDIARALEYFELAGYSQKDGKLVNAEGEQLKLVAGIVEADTHPAAKIFMQMSEDLASMGAELTIKESTFEDLVIQVQNDELDMWAMAWGNVKNCDIMQMFGSNGELNYYKYLSEELDSIQEEIIQTKDFNKRCELVSQELDMIMEAAICMPLYQKKYIHLYSRY